MTEHVRFNDDGSSDHIKVVDGELVGHEHWDVAPYYRLDPEIAWIIHNAEKPEVENND